MSAFDVAVTIGLTLLSSIGMTYLIQWIKTR